MRAIRRMAVIDTRKIKPGDRYALLFDTDVSVAFIGGGRVENVMVNVKAGVEFVVCSYDSMSLIVRCMPVRSNEFIVRLKGVDKRSISSYSVYFSTDTIEQSMRKIK